MNMHRSGANAEPDFAMALTRIQHMSREELNDLLNSEAKLEEYVKSLDQVSSHTTKYVIIDSLQPLKSINFWKVEEGT